MRGGVSGLRFAPSGLRNRKALRPLNYHVADRRHHA
jgi:hypothetical protein